VDQAAGDIKTPAQKPQDQEDRKNGPKHSSPRPENPVMR
jgi:hypothetical protein